MQSVPLPHGQHMVISVIFQQKDLTSWYQDTTASVAFICMLHISSALLNIVYVALCEVALCPIGFSGWWLEKVPPFHIAVSSAGSPAAFHDHLTSDPYSCIRSIPGGPFLPQWDLGTRFWGGFEGWRGHH